MILNKHLVGCFFLGGMSEGAHMGIVLPNALQTRLREVCSAARQDSDTASK